MNVAISESEDRKFAALRAWFDPDPYYEDNYLRHLHKCSKIDDTCSWAFQDSNDVGRLLLHWQGTDKDYSLVQVTGDPGQGKSVLAAQIIERYEVPLYFFCPDAGMAKTTPEKLLRTLAYCLAIKDPVVRAKYLSLKETTLPLENVSFNLLWEKLFKAILNQDLSRTFHCVIDGFDQIPDHKALISHFLGLREFRTNM